MASSAAVRQFKTAGLTFDEAVRPRRAVDRKGRVRALPSHLDRFFANVRAEGDCWIWTKTLNAKGYASFYVTSEFSVPAHRFIYELLRVEIPLGLQLDHLCRMRSCVNPWHLEPVTNRENQLRGDRGVSFLATCPNAGAHRRRGQR